MTRFSLDWVKRLRDRGVINKVVISDISNSKRLADNGGFSTQTYIEGLFDLKLDEALILETKLPEKCRYWNFQLDDEFWGSGDWMNRQTSLNGFSARVDADGGFRVVISAQDPGVPNWLDTAGHQRGGMMGRWNTCSSAPLPTAQVVKVTDVRTYLPADTPTVSADARDAAIRLRRKAVQMRRKW